MCVCVSVCVCDCNADVGPAQVLFLNGSTWIQLMSVGGKVTPLRLKMKAQCMQGAKAAIHVWLSQAFVGGRPDALQIQTKPDKISGVKITPHNNCIVCHCFSQCYAF